MKKVYFLVTVFCSTFLLFGCVSKQLDTEVNDLKIYKQDAKEYTSSLPTFDKDIQEKLNKEFDKRYFKPWHKKNFKASIKDVTWQFNYKNKKVYGDNNRLLTKEWFDEQINNSNFEKYNTFLRKAITVKNTNLRVFPTNSKIFYNPSIAGEGFPFDYNQNSGIKINSPILISHFSKDRAWAYVLSSFAKGWIDVNDLAYVDDKIINFFENQNYYVAIKDNFPIYKKGIFLEYIKVGTLFPVKNNKAITVGRYANNHGYIRVVEIPNLYISKKPIEFNNANVSNIINELLKEPYGWGEALSHRDCSALTKDYFAPFGINLKRNSYGQTLDYRYLDISSFTNKKKKEFILKNGIPFLTLAYMKGHIMIYIGQKNNEPLFFHNVWGVKTKDFFGNDGRKIVGKAVITTLNMGEDISGFDEKRSLASRLLGIINVTQKKK
ncbi:MAG: SH3 domain-containing protein [Arcobacter sp.]|uniref:SH3 domain-containing C40 family peptidase n=1 Tax=Arcobacter sp. TaxID=1872629 RepID=UPI003AFFCB42